MTKRKKRSLVFVSAVLIAGGLFAFLTNRWFVNPQVTEILEPADAIVVFPGGAREDVRFDRALELMDQGLAPVLFIATDRDQRPLEAAICDGSDYAFETACRLSDPRSTFGNARATAAEASAQGWDSVILVTADDHITRSHMLLGRCFDGRIQTAVSVNENRRRLGRTIYEWAAMGKALFADRC